MNNNIPELIDRFFDSTCTVEEILRLDEWYYSYDAESDPEELLDKDRWPAFEALMLERINENIRKVEARQGVVEKRPVKLKWITYAVSGIAAMLLIAAGTYFLYPVKQSRLIPNNTAATLPARQNKLMLTLSNGNRVYLDKDSENLKESDGTEIAIKHNTITYHNTRPGNPNAQNVLNVPTGHTYRVNLADGTAVWLNNVSELTYPVSFNRLKDRVVTLKGEAYFEVFHDASRPFKVNVIETEITVLGTKFNVNTFHKGAVTTTLLQGSVKVNSKGSTGLLKPGQQAVTGQANISIGQADIQKAIAWKNGYFIFKKDGIETILEQLARWYNVEVKYPDAMQPGLHYSGKIPRSASLSEVSGMLSDITGLKFKCIANTLIVNNK